MVAENHRYVKLEDVQEMVKRLADDAAHDQALFAAKFDRRSRKNYELLTERKQAFLLVLHGLETDKVPVVEMKP